MDIVVADSGKFTMDLVVTMTGVLRLLLLCIVFAMNCQALVRVCFRSSLCMHSMITTALILANILYMVTWLPFVVYSLSSGSWSLLKEQVYCLSQNYAVNAMGMVFLSMLTVRIVDRVWRDVFGRPPLGGLQSVTITFLMWIFPQLAYDVIAIIWKHRLCQSPVFHFLSKIVNIIPRGSKSGYTLGFMVCQQEVTPVMINVHLWQYTVLVLPLSTITVIGMIALSIKRTKSANAWSSTWASSKPLSSDNNTTHGVHFNKRICQIKCQRRMVIVDLILYCNFIWHLIGRPLPLLQVLIEKNVEYFSPVFLDVGSHVMLAISCVVIPSICLKLSSDFKDMARTKLPLANVISVPVTKGHLTNACFIKNPIIFNEAEHKSCLNNSNVI